MEYRSQFWKALLVAFCVSPPSGWLNNANAQDPLWMIGDRAVHFPQAQGEEVRTSPLPTSFDPSIPDEYEYQGQIAEHTQNVQYDENGNLLFFIIDGNVYNGHGLLIADDAADIDDRDCEVCFIGGEQVHILPVPGSCTRYMVIGLFFENYQRDNSSSGMKSMLRWGVIDMALKNDLPVYEELCAPVGGRFMNIDERQAANMHLTSVDGNWGALVIEPDNAPANMYAYLEDGTIRSSTAEANEAIYAASAQVDNAGRHIMAVRCNQALVMLQIDATGIKKLVAPGVGAAWPFAIIDENNSVVDRDISQRGEIALRVIGNTLHVAHSGYWWEPLDPQFPAPIWQQTLVTYWKFDLSLGATMGVTANFTPAGVPNANPRSYSLDRYLNDAPPLDFAGNVILRPAVCGLEFSPNGRYIYFVKSPNFAYPNSGGDESNFGYIDLQWVLGDPGTYYSFLPIDTPIETRELADTQMGINVGPEGSGSALYMLGADAVGEYWLGTFSDPDDPDPDNWQISPAQLGNIAFMNEITSPTTQFRFMPARVGNGTHYTAMNALSCCNDLVLTHDMSTTITDGCDLTWQPGNNAFWNTTDPIHVATELRIAEGSHVVASNMHFRFGTNASLIIEKGASLKCTNCTFTNACDNQRWKGIEVHGVTLQHQFGPGHPTHQGQLELFASTVENAITGINAAAPYYKTTAGAVINCAAATVLEDTDGDGDEEFVWKRTIIRNCREGVKFYPYQNFNPNTGAPLQNLSRFRDCLFTVTPDYPVAFDFLRHAYLWKVDGIPFIACTFENTLSDASFGFTGSQGLGHGIYSLDANYRVLSACNLLLPVGGPPCPENQTRRSKFIGLDHGIHAMKSTTLRNFTVDRAEFTNNICGIYSSGVVGFVARNNNINLGGRNVTLTGDDDVPFNTRRRGI